MRILTEPQNALVKQNTALLGNEDLSLSFTPDAIERIADFAPGQRQTENIGAGRLHTVMERLLDEFRSAPPS